MAHYVLTCRSDTPYWRQIRDHTPLPDTLAEVLRDARNGSYQSIDRLQDKFYEALNWNTILSGMGFFGESSSSSLHFDGSPIPIHAKLLQAEVFDGDYAEPEGIFAAPATNVASWHSTW